VTLTLSLEEWVYIIYQDVDGDNYTRMTVTSGVTLK
jgi:hypothetical protein